MLLLLELINSVINLLSFIKFRFSFLLVDFKNLQCIISYRIIFYVLWTIYFIIYNLMVLILSIRWLIKVILVSIILKAFLFNLDSAQVGCFLELIRVFHDDFRNQFILLYKSFLKVLDLALIDRVFLFELFVLLFNLCQLSI